MNIPMDDSWVDISSQLFIDTPTNVWCSYNIFTFSLSRSYNSVVLLCDLFIFVFFCVLNWNSWDYTNVNWTVSTRSNLITYIVLLFSLAIKDIAEEEQELALVSDKLKMLAKKTVYGYILAFSLITPHLPPTIVFGKKCLTLSLINSRHLQTHICCVQYCSS